MLHVTLATKLYKLSMGSWRSDKPNKCFISEFQFGLTKISTKKAFPNKEKYVEALQITISMILVSNPMGDLHFACYINQDLV